MILSYRLACRRTDSVGPPISFHRTAPPSQSGDPQCLIGSWISWSSPRQDPMPWVMGFTDSVSTGQV